VGGVSRREGSGAQRMECLEKGNWRCKAVGAFG